MSAPVSDQALDHRLAKLLRLGIYATVAFFTAGLVAAVFGHPPAPAYPQTLRALVRGLVRFDPEAYFFVGTIALIATPILRVVFSLIVFARTGDRRYFFVTLVVLVVIIVSVVLGSVFALRV